MKPTADFDPSRLARSLLRRSRQGALATLMAGSGDPYCSLVNVASHADASPILLISRLALHTKNILGDNRVSLMLDERAAGDPLEGARIMLAGRAEEAAPDQVETLRRRYLNAHPSAEAFIEFKDFSFFRIVPSSASPVLAASSTSSQTNSSPISATPRGCWKPSRARLST
jgi:putative heme iron utilization protein